MESRNDIWSNDNILAAARLAYHVYQPKPQDYLPESFHIINNVDSSDGSLRATFYQFESSEQIFVAIRGSDGLTNFVRDDMPIAFNHGLSEQASQFCDQVLTAIQDYDTANVIVTGHSLGAYLGTEVGMRNGCAVIAWDSPGVSTQLLAEYQSDHANWGNITVMQAPENPVNLLWNAPIPFIRMDGMADARIDRFVATENAKNDLDDRDSDLIGISYSATANQLLKYHEMARIKEHVEHRYAQQKVLDLTKQLDNNIVESLDKHVAPKVDSEAVKDESANSIPSSLQQQPNETLPTKVDSTVKINSAEKAVREFLSKLVAYEEGLEKAQVSNEDKKNAEINLPEFAAKAVAAICNGLFQAARIINHNIQMQEHKISLIRYSQQISDSLTFDIDITRYVKTAIPLSDLYQQISRDAYYGIRRNIREQRAFCEKLMHKIDQARDAIANSQSIMGECATLIAKVDADLIVMYRKIASLHYNDAAAYLSAAATSFTAAATCVNPVLGAGFSAIAAISSFIQEGSSERFRRRLARYQAKIQELHAKREHFYQLNDVNQARIADYKSGILQIQAMVLQCGEYADPEKFRQFLHDELGKCAAEIDEIDKEIKDKKDKLEALDNNVKKLQEEKNKLKQELKDKNDDKDKGVKNKKHRKKKHIEKDIKKNKDKRAVAKQEAAEQAPLLKTQLTQLEDAKKPIEETIEALLARQRFEGNAKEVRDWWYKAYRADMKPLTPEEQRLADIQQAASEEYVKYLEDFDRKILKYKLSINSLKNLTTSLQSLGLEKPHQFMNVVDTLFQMNNILTPLAMSSTRFYQLFQNTYNADGTIATMTAKDIFEAIERFGGDTQSVIELLSPSINLLALGVKLIGIIYGVVPKNPIVVQMQAQFQQLGKYLDGKFNQLLKVLGQMDQTLNAKIDNMSRRIHEIRNGVVALQFKLDGLQRQLVDLQVRGNNLSRLPDPLYAKNTVLAYEGAVTKQIQSNEKRGSDAQYRSEIDDMFQDLDQFLTRAQHAKDDRTSSLGTVFDGNRIPITEKPHEFIDYIASRFDPMHKPENRNLYVNFNLYYSAVHHIISTLERIEKHAQKTQDNASLELMFAKFYDKLAKTTDDGAQLLEFLLKIKEPKASLISEQIVRLCHAYQSLEKEIHNRYIEKSRAQQARNANVIAAARSAVLCEIQDGLVKAKNEAETTVVGTDKFFVTNLFTLPLAITTEFDYFEFMEQRGQLPLKAKILLPLIPFYKISALISKSVTADIFLSNQFNRVGRLYFSLAAFKDHQYNIFGFARISHPITMLYLNPATKKFEFGAQAKIAESELKKLKADFATNKKEGRWVPQVKELRVREDYHKYPIRIDISEKLENHLSNHPKMYLNDKLLTDEVYKVLISPLPDAIFKIKIESKDDFDRMKMQIDEFHKWYNQTYLQYINAYIDEVSKIIQDKSYDCINTDINNTKISSGILIAPARHDNKLLPLILPSSLLTKHINETEQVRALAAYERQGVGKVESAYSFDLEQDKVSGKQVYQLRIVYQLMHPDVTAPLGVVSQVVAAFDPVTVEVFTKYYPADDHAQQPNVYINLNEFLITAIYGSPGCGGLVCDKTFVFSGADLISPVELPFEGCYQILEKMPPNYVFNFDRHHYNADTMKKLNDISHGSVAEFTAALKDLSTFLVDSRNKVEFALNHPAIMRVQDDIYDLHSSLETLTPSSENSSDTMYQLLMQEYRILIALIKLVANVNTVAAEDLLKSKLGIQHPTRFAEIAINNYQSYLELIKSQSSLEIPQDVMREFIRLINPMESKLIIDLHSILCILRKWKTRVLSYVDGKLPEAAIEHYLLLDKRWMPPQDSVAILAQPDDSNRRTAAQEVHQDSQASAIKKAGNLTFFQPASARTGVPDTKFDLLSRAYK